jgi:DNA topoisomerase-2
LKVIGMAQDFCGSNNINLLVPQGQFGTRLAGGDDAASPRYIFTYLSPVARYLFPEADDALLSYLEDDGQLIEPEFYCPIIPLLLVNGSQGIGTGWSTHIPPHKPLDVLNYIRSKLDGRNRKVEKIRPWARGFTGSIEPKEDGSGYVSTGRAKSVSKNSVLIDELPVKQWTDDYKEHLIRMRDKGEITHFVENHTTTSVSFTVKLSSAALQKMERSGLEKAFKLQANLATTNMHAFDTGGNIVKFGSAESIADAFFPTRLALYYDRKSVLESEMNHEATVLRNKARFITSVTSGEIDLLTGRKSRDAIVEALHKREFASASALTTIKNNNTVAARKRQKLIDDEVAEIPDTSPFAEFDYLLNMPLSSLTTERIDALHREALQKDKELAELLDTTPEDLWRHDLDKLAKHL